jgi:hypothetical protein
VTRSAPLKTKRLPAKGSLKTQIRLVKSLVRAPGKQGYQHHEIGERKQPLVRGHAGCFRSARDETEMTALCEIV